MNAKHVVVGAVAAAAALLILRRVRKRRARDAVVAMLNKQGLFEAEEEVAVVAGRELEADEEEEAVRGQPAVVCGASVGVRVQHPEIARIVFHESTFKRWMPYRPPLSLFSAEGEDHKRHRKVVAAAFDRNFISALENLTRLTTGDLVEHLSSLEDNTLRDTLSFANRAVQEAVLTFTYGDPVPECVAAQSAALFSGTFAAMFNLLLTSVPLVRSIPFGRPAHLRRLSQRVTATLRQRIATYRARHAAAAHAATLVSPRPDESTEEASSMLELLVRANALHGDALSDEEVVSNAIGFGIGGNDSTAAALVAVLYELARSPAEQDALRRDMAGARGRSASVDNFLREALRLHPPFYAALSRSNLHADVQLENGMVIPRGVSVSVDLARCGRHAAAFGDDAARFDPRRYGRRSQSSIRQGGIAHLESIDHLQPLAALARSERAHSEENARRYADVVWGGGQRKCVGRRLALTILRAWTVSIVNSFDVSFETGCEAVRLVAGGASGYSRVTEPNGRLGLVFKPLS